MASYTLKTKNISPKTQGWFSTSGTGTNGTININFGSAIDEFRKKVDVNNITIDSAMLQFNCTDSGKDDKKDFKLSVESYGALGTFRSSSSAYNAWTDINLGTSACSTIRNWVIGDKNYMYSTDPYPSRFRDHYYSNNYVSVVEANLILNYTVNKSSASLSNTTMELGKSYNITITAGSSSYTHNINIIIGSHSYSVASGVSSGTKSIIIPTSIGSEEMSKTKTKSAILRLTTFNGSSNLGDNDYSITIEAGSDCAPSMNDISLTLSATPNSSFSGSGKVVLNGRTSVTLSTSASGKYGATISSYSISGAGLSGSNTSGSFTSVINQTGSQNVTITATDSRGYTVSKTKTVKITNYSLPSIENLVIYRCNSSGNRDDVSGKYAKITFSKVFTSPIINATSGGEISNSLTVKIGSTTLNSGSVFGGSYNIDSTYDLSIVSSDTVGYSTTVTFTLPSSSYLLHFRRQQNSVGVGCAGEDLTGSSDSGRLTVGWNTKFNSNVTFNGGLVLKKALDVNQGGTGATSETGIVNNIKSALINTIYPVGSIYISVNSTNPSSIFGGTWVAWGAGRVPVGVSSGDANFGSVEQTGGEKTHTLTTEEVPAHYHIPSRGTMSDGSSFYFTTNATLGTNEVARKGVASSSSASGGYAMTSTNSGYIYDAPQTNTVGGGGAHNNIQPYITCYMWKRTA